MENQNMTDTKVNSVPTELITVRELYEWARQNDMLDAPIGLQYQDEGGTYCGDTYANGYAGTPYPIIASKQTCNGNLYVHLE